MNNHREVNNGLSILNDIVQEDELLDIQEKTSLVFLMCDDAFKALYILTTNILKWGKYNKILPDLIGYLKQTDQEILNKFLESLILIKNYQVVKQLGFDINNLKVMFEERENKHYINCVRKALLRMCESLTDEELTVLIRLIKQDFTDTGGFSSLRETNLMEFSLLYLICEDYISDGTNNRESNVNNLIRHLKTMNKHDLVRELKKVTHSVDEIEQTIMCPDNDFSEKNCLLNFAPKHFVSSDADCYKMDINNMGLCVIINQRNFCEQQGLAKGVKLGTRTGTNCDREILNITFTGLGFKTIIKENLSSDNLLRYLRNVVQRVKKIHSCFVLCILSHGKQGEVYCIDGIPIKVEEIERMISGDQCPQLLGKPKLVFVQACQGNEYQKALPCSVNIQEDDDGNGDEKMPECDGPTKFMCEQKVPPTADMLTFWATVPGFASFRLPQVGTVFVKTLCACLLKSDHFYQMQDVVRIVNDRLSQTQFGEQSYVSMPQVKHTLTKKLYFPYCPEHRLKAAQMLYMKFLVEALIALYSVKMGVLIHHFKEKQKKKMTCITK